MKNIGNFIIGSVSTLGVSSSLQAAETAQKLPAEIVNSIDAIISLLGGVLSAIIVAWLQRKWQQKDSKSNNE